MDSFSNSTYRRFCWEKNDRLFIYGEKRTASSRKTDAYRSTAFIDEEEVDIESDAFEEGSLAISVQLLGWWSVTAISEPFRTGRFESDCNVAGVRRSPNLDVDYRTLLSFGLVVLARELVHENVEPVVGSGQRPFDDGVETVHCWRGWPRRLHDLLLVFREVDMKYFRDDFAIAFEFQSNGVGVGRIVPEDDIADCDAGVLANRRDGASGE